MRIQKDFNPPLKKRGEGVLAYSIRVSRLKKKHDQMYKDYSTWPTAKFNAKYFPVK